MIKTKITIDDVIALLNEIAQLDPVALSYLLKNYVACNEALANHPTIQVGPGAEDGPCTIGIVGILNGIFGTLDRSDQYDQWGPICLMENDDGTQFFIRSESYFNITDAKGKP